MVWYGMVDVCGRIPGRRSVRVQLRPDRDNVTRQILRAVIRAHLPALSYTYETLCTTARVVCQIINVVFLLVLRPLFGAEAPHPGAVRHSATH